MASMPMPAVAAVLLALLLSAPQSGAVEAPSEPEGCTGPDSTCGGIADLAAAAEGEGADAGAGAALHLLQRKFAALHQYSADTEQPADFSKCSAMAKCKGCGGEGCSYCRQEADLECCLDMKCHGCSGEACGLCRNDNLAKCCAGAPMHVRKCKHLHLLQQKVAASEQSLVDVEQPADFSKCSAMAKCKGCSGEACSYCRQEADLECCLDMKCHGCSGEACGLCRNDNLAKCCAGAPMHVRKCQQSSPPAQHGHHGQQHGQHHGHHGGHHGHHGQQHGHQHGHHGGSTQPDYSKCAAMAKCKGCSGEACSYCRQEADLECCLDMKCHGCSGEACGACHSENLAKCCAGAPMHVRKCQQANHGR